MPVNVISLALHGVLLSTFSPSAHAVGTHDDAKQTLGKWKPLDSGLPCSQIFER